ncbi:hypothetical protein M0M57_07795 [Flavobacterium azooxidireducens]|uniref:Homing endonuclease LAGLIDADG domain-containing protein n=1 Tax=Flavobacterium azooxidireducens TaxID=1871076 RepID=A0ABY4KK16_9FLAO|nr:hypothetical protein [Flavobacterium azooxidireducens]UPQ80730.1 hypothetical protein M0M57_07795 [Flavobacterium azooxidireducens]
MGRYGNYPKTVEDCKVISISNLKKWNYFTCYGNKSGSINWSRNGVRTSSIGIEVTFTDAQKFIILDYKTNDESIRYKVNIIAKPSNLGKGEVYYFLCPSTGKICRKLYFESGYFLHRTAFRNLMYERQIESKKNRELLKVLDASFIPDEVYGERYKPYFKTHYKGKPTKRYVRLQTRINIADSYPPDTFERLAMM